MEPTDDLAGSIFGSCIALEGDTLLVGSPWGREGDLSSGVVYHFERIGKGSQVSHNSRALMSNVALISTIASHSNHMPQTIHFLINVTLKL